MVISMTGFGRGEAEVDGYRVQVEMKSVNGRYGEVSVYLPRTLSELEARIKELVLAVFTRGHVNVSVNVSGDEVEQGLPVLNRKVLAAYQAELAVLQEQVRSSGSPDPMQIAMLPNLFAFESKPPDLEAVWQATKPACEAAVKQCQAMRLGEGQKLAADFVSRIHRLEALLHDVEKLAPGRVESARKKLEEKLQELFGPEQIDENRLLMEIALIAERSDITEEYVRFHSHNEQFLKTLDRDDAIGRRLNFLLQEMLREANTIGSKANNAEIAHLVVEMKEEIEKLKEQVQNIE